MLPTVDFCGLKVTRLVIGANPFGGYSHQSEKRDKDDMVEEDAATVREIPGR